MTQLVQVTGWDWQAPSSGPMPAGLGHPQWPCLLKPQSLGPICSKAGALLALLVSVKGIFGGQGWLQVGGGCALPFTADTCLGLAEGFPPMGVAALGIHWAPGSWWQERGEAALWGILPARAAPS